MNIEELRNYCLLKKGATECFPFDESTLVFKVSGKMFALIPLEKVPLQINLKCDPEMAIDLRDRYNGVTPGYHMNKNYWNTVICDDLVNDQLLLKWIDNSYELVVNSLSKKLKESLR